MERLTTSEAAVAAGVSVPQIHRIIDEKILPEDLYSTAQMRTFRTEACVLIAFYFETADSLTASGSSCGRSETRWSTAPLGSSGELARLRIAP